MCRLQQTLHYLRRSPPNVHSSPNPAWVSRSPGIPGRPYVLPVEPATQKLRVDVLPLWRICTDVGGGSPSWFRGRTSLEAGPFPLSRVRSGVAEGSSDAEWQPSWPRSTRRQGITLFAGLNRSRHAPTLLHTWLPPVLSGPPGSHKLGAASSTSTLCREKSGVGRPSERTSGRRRSAGAGNASYPEKGRIHISRQ